MDHGKAILIILVSSLWVFTVCALVFAIVRRRNIRRDLRWSADYEDVLAYGNEQLVFESLRLVCHTVIVWLILITPEKPPPLAEIRNIGIAFLGVVMGFKSAWMLYRRRKRYQRYRKAHP